MMVVVSTSMNAPLWRWRVQYDKLAYLLLMYLVNNYIHSWAFPVTTVLQGDPVV
jgi:hypothetical protein